MSENNNRTNDPAAKVERMNHIFDHVVLPMILFTVVMFVVSAIMFRPDSCTNRNAEQPEPTVNHQNLDAFLMREVLLDDMESNRTIFELGGYTVVESEQSGLVAYRQLDDNTQIFENIADGSGGRYSAVVYEKDNLAVMVRIYSRTIFLVEAANGDRAVSAIFRDDRFSTWTSGGDADASSVLELVTADQLCGMIDRYKESILSLVIDDNNAK